MQPTVYRIVVRGRLTDRLGPAFDGLDLQFSNANTGLVGEVCDQSQLYGVLDTIRALGLELISAAPDAPGGQALLRPVEEATGVTGEPAPRGPSVTVASVARTPTCPLPEGPFRPRRPRRSPPSQAVRVRAAVGETLWLTSVFPDSSRRAFVLPVKKAVRTAESLDVGPRTEVLLDLVATR